MMQGLAISVGLALVWLAAPAGAQPSPAVAPAPAAASAPATASASAPVADAAALPVVVTPLPVPKPATTKVRLTTSAGPIVIAVETERAPATAANFLRYVDAKRFDGTTFYRAMQLGTDGAYGLIQGGIKGNTKAALAPVVHEPTSKTGLTHDEGAISMARGAPGSATGDFFIIIGTLTGLDAKPGGPGDNQGYAVFGHVVEGLELVRQIQHMPTSPTLGEGVMKGQMLAEPVKILSVKRVR